ncbi:MAG: glycine cleavage system aminomethyltransferase GcvT, partial [Actinomycetota bacterium]
MTDAELRHSPLEDAHRRLGAKLGAFGGWLMPIEYAGTLSEHRAVRERAGLFDLSHLGKVDVVGPSSLPTIQRLFTNDARRVGVGTSQYHQMLNERGGVEEDLFMYRLGEERWFVVPNAANKDRVVEALRGAAADEAAVIDHDDWGFLAVQGPRSQEIVTALWQDAELSFRGCRIVHYGDAEVVLARTGYTGERGYELFAINSVVAELWDALTMAGADVQMEPCGLGARDVLRLEMGYPL